MNSTGPIRLFVLIDALGWPYVEQSKFLADVLPHRSSLSTVLGYSSGAVPTILTGQPPAETGHWNLFYYDPENSPFRWLRYFSFLPSALLDHRVTRKLLKEMGRHLLGLGPLFECNVSPRFLPWFNWVEKRNLYAAGGVEKFPSIFDQLEERGIPYRTYSYHDCSDAEILHRAHGDVSRRATRFFFLYLSEMDMFLHQHCHDPQRVERRLAWYGDRLRELFETARQVHKNSTLVIFSDHGMTSVTNHFDVVGEVDALGVRMPKDYLAVYDSTMARFWFFSDAARRSISDRLQALDCGRVLAEDELKRLGVFFPDRRYGELIFLMHPGWLMGRSDFNGRRWWPKGMHGYHPEDPDSDAVFLSSYVPSSAPRTIADVYKCMCEAVQ